MTLDEALDELGVGADAGPEEARRAYLRLLKKRKPEVDPEGFMRLREAYELVKNRADFMASWRVVVTHPRETAEAKAPLVEAPPEPVEERESPAPADEASHAPADGEREAPEGDSASTEDDAAPSEAEGDAEPRPPLGLDAVEGMIEAGEHGAAASVLAEIYEDAAHDIRAHVPPIHRTLWLILSLYAEGDHEAAKGLYDAASHWLSANGLEARVLRGELAARWMVARELSALPSSFSKVVRKAIARAAEGGELADARDALVRYQAKRPARAFEAATMLKTRAPALASVFAATLESPPANEATPTTRAKGMSGWMIATIVIALLRILMAIGKSSTPSPSFDPTRMSPPQIALMFGDGGATMPSRPSPLDDLEERAKHRADRMRAHADYAMADAGKKRFAVLEAISTKSIELRLALDRGDCAGARALARDLRAANAPDAGDAIGRTEAETLEQAVRAYCAAVDASRRDAGDP